jgi:hypothetical protein
MVYGREQLENLLGAVLSENVGIIAGVLGRTQDGTETELELLLLPLVLEGHSRVRALGALAPLAPPYWLANAPQARLGSAHFIIGAEHQIQATALPFGGRRAPNKARFPLQRRPGCRPTSQPANPSLTIG